MKKLIFFTIVLSSMLLFSQAGATDYYVRPAGTTYGSGNGTSYANAWSGFSSINWTAVNNGNGILWADGTHNERLTVGASGESGTPIYIKGYSSNISIQGIYMSNKSWVTIDGVTVENYTGTDGGVRIEDDSNNVTIKNCIIQNNTNNGIGHASGGADNLIIENNIIRNNGSGTTAMNQGIFYAGNSVVIRNNTIYNNGWSNSYMGQKHGIYLGNGLINPSIEIYGNTIYGHTHGNGIQAKSSANIYNNIIYGNADAGIHPGENSSTTTVNVHHNLLYFNENSGIAVYATSGTMNVNIYNNSFYRNGTASTGDWYAEIFVESNITSLSIKNNILYAGASNTTLGIYAAQSNMTCNNNIHYGPSGNPISYGGSTLTWNYWRSTLGMDTNSYNTNPLYLNPPSDMTLQSSSPGISLNAGAYASGGAPPPSTNLKPLVPIIMGVN